MKTNSDGILYYSMPKQDPIQERQLSRQLLKTAYADFFQKEYEETSICRREHGKPYDSRNNQIRFNLSHCRSAAAAAVSYREVGVDIEALRRVNGRTVMKCCSPDEISYVFFDNETNSSANYILTESETKRFLQLWTLKESIVKMTGEGLRTPFQEVCFDPASIKDCKEGKIYPI